MIHRSPLPDIALPQVPVHDFVMAGFQPWHNKVALLHAVTGEKITFGQLQSRVESLAGGLHAIGLEKGDVVSILSGNSMEYAIVLLAVSRCGGIVSTISSYATEHELHAALNLTQSKFLIASDDFDALATRGAAQTSVKTILSYGKSSDGQSLLDLENLGAVAPRIEFDPQADTVYMPFSSGTTGFPKAVMLSHHNVTSNLLQISAMETVSEHDVYASFLPFFHIYGSVVILLYGLRHGVTNVIMPKYDLETFLQVVQEHRVTRGHFVPPIAKDVAYYDKLDQYDLSSLKRVLCGAAPISPTVANHCAQRLGCSFKQGYGMTEMSPICHFGVDEGDKVNDVTCAGVLVPNTECRIVDVESQQDVEGDQAGEILIRGPQVMQGYLGDAAATQMTLDDDGWIHTGDIGFVASSGGLYVTDRIKEMIKYKGIAIAPAELEAILMTHPDVLDAAVVPHLDANSGEIPKAFVVTTGNIPLQPILEFVAARVASYKKIRDIEEVDSIPKSPSGKILRRLLIEQDRGKS